MGGFVSPVVSKALRHFRSYGSSLFPLLPSPISPLLHTKASAPVLLYDETAIFFGCSSKSQTPSNLDDFSEKSSFPTVIL